MMQNISVLMSPRSPSGFTDIKKPNVSHHPVQAKNLHFNPLVVNMSGYEARGPGSIPGCALNFSVFFLSFFNILMLNCFIF